MPRSHANKRHAIVSLRIPQADWVELTEPSVQRYAERHGCDVVNLREPRLDLTVLRWRRRWRNLHLEKFQIHDLLEDYDRILYLDADVLIHPDAPNLFDRVPENAFGAVNEQLGLEAPKREQEWRWMQRRLGRLPNTPHRYFNAGVMLFSRQHQELFAHRGRRFAAGRWPDQNTLNYYAQREAVQMCWLSEEWNCMPVFGESFTQAERRRNAFMVHYAGEPAKAALHADLQHFDDLAPQQAALMC